MTDKTQLEVRIRSEGIINERPGPGMGSIHSQSSLSEKAFLIPLVSIVLLILYCVQFRAWGGTD